MPLETLAMTTATTALLDRPRITVREAAERTSYSVAFLYRQFERGQIEGVRAGRSVRLYVDSIEEWLRRNNR
jgi:excisionase family DNA binding protein